MCVCICMDGEKEGKGERDGGKERERERERGREVENMHRIRTCIYIQIFFKIISYSSPCHSQQTERHEKYSLQQVHKLYSQYVDSCHYSCDVVSILVFIPLFPDLSIAGPVQKPISVVLVSL